MLRRFSAEASGVPFEKVWRCTRDSSGLKALRNDALPGSAQVAANC